LHVSKLGDENGGRFNFIFTVVLAEEGPLGLMDEQSFLVGVVEVVCVDITGVEVENAFGRDIAILFDVSDAFIDVLVSVPVDLSLCFAAFDLASNLSSSGVADAGPAMPRLLTLLLAVQESLFQFAAFFKSSFSCCLVLRFSIRRCPASILPLLFPRGHRLGKAARF